MPKREVDFPDVLTPAQRKKYNREMKRLDKLLKPFVDELRRSTQLTAEDYAVTINAR